ncbi:OfxX fusion product [Flexibacterium corallicola]|uniref:OfxX fusion product n=1 Tax=Flexibacterium corallicola TaxID=3037259 RepID=UPI00286EF7E9|nr:OfxX fusion product [Pseudovibrio sp. M1P-2-3]
MRVKLQGEITVERLSEALQAALQELENVRPGSKIYGANLYLNLYDPYGLPFGLVDDSGDKFIIDLPAKPGELVKPALTAEAVQIRQEAIKEAARQAAEQEALRQERLEIIRRESQERKQQNEQREKQFQNLNAVTEHLVKTMPERFVHELNTTVQAVWEELKPVEPHGKRKGEPKPLPSFHIKDGFLELSTKSWKQAKIIRNPVGTRSNSEIVPIWRHDAWIEAVRRINHLMEDLSKATVNGEAVT